MNKMLRAISFLLLCALPGCDDDTPPGPNTEDVLTLSAAQAADLVDRVAEFSDTDPSLSALSDTVQFVLTAGAQARRIDVETDIGGGPYWAVSLHRAQTHASNSWSTFHVISFNDPSNPTRFLILGGWASDGATPPSTVTGSLSGPTATTSVTAHLFSLNGTELSVWHATAGSVTFTSTGSSEACPGFTATGMTCARASMTGAFNITSSIPGSGSAATGSRTASSDGTTPIPGVRLSM